MIPSVLIIALWEFLKPNHGSHPVIAITLLLMQEHASSHFPKQDLDMKYSLNAWYQHCPASSVTPTLFTAPPPKKLVKTFSYLLVKVKHVSDLHFQTSRPISSQYSSRSADPQLSYTSRNQKHPCIITGIENGYRRRDTPNTSWLLMLDFDVSRWF